MKRTSCAAAEPAQILDPQGIAEWLVERLADDTPTLVGKRILGGATSVVEGLGSLRRKIGDAHGQGGKPARPTARRAQLAVNLAGAMAHFWWTHGQPSSREG
jgi:hypothetical protein